MQIQADNPNSYIEAVPEKHREAVRCLRRTILTHLPEGFEETMQYGMISGKIPLQLRIPNGLSYICGS